MTEGPNLTGMRRKTFVLSQLLAHGREPVEELLALLPDLDPQEKAQIWMKLLAFCYPTLKSIEVEKDPSLTLQVTALNVAELCQAARDGAMAQIMHKAEEE